MVVLLHNVALTYQIVVVLANWLAPPKAHLRLTFGGKRVTVTDSMTVMKWRGRRMAHVLSVVVDSPGAFTVPLSVGQRY